MARGAPGLARLQVRQQQRAAFEDADPHLVDRVQRMHLVARQRARAVTEFGRQLNSGGAAADDYDVQPRATGAGLDAAVHEALAERLCLGHVVEREYMFGGAGHAKKIGH